MFTMQAAARQGHSSALLPLVSVLRSATAALRMVLEEHRRSLSAAQRYEQLRPRARGGAGATVFAEFYAG